ncbi:MAG TPA: hypothetical protein VK200_06165, partial [Candidatus Limnocylindrales bacterium]|nr:hypothetical protein [Candidatus Limnocylindrales bacterium]
MDSMFIWIVMFAGAAIALLAVFLVASEKELKKKRLEIDQLLTKVGDTAGTADMSGAGEMTPGFNSQELNELRARNQELERELAAVSNKLESGADTSEELELAQRNVEIAKSNAQWLQSNNDELKAQIEDLKARLTASEARADDFSSGSLGGIDRQRELEREIVNLQERLSESRSQSRELDGMEHKLANAAAIESTHREEKAQLQAKIGELEKELSAANAARTSEVESSREQLAESERIQRLMRDERRGIEQEMGRWQAKVNQAEEQSRQLSALREPFNKLLAKQSALEERQREYHEAMASFSQLLARSHDSSPHTKGFNEFQAATAVVETGHTPIENNLNEADGAAVSPAQIIAAAQTAEKPKRRFGLFPLVIVLVFGATMVALWSMQGSDTTTTANALPVSQNKAPAPAVRAALPEPIASEPATPAETPAAKEI